VLFADGMHRLGIGLDRGRPHVWIHGADLARFTAMRPALLALRDAVPRCGHFLTANSPEMRTMLQAAFPDATILPPPIDVGPAAQRFIARSDPRVVVVLEPAPRLGSRVLEALGARSCEVISVGADLEGAGLRAAVVGEVTRALRAAPVRGTADPVVVSSARAKAIRDLDALSAELDHPKRLLCLGNGPSVLAPELDGLRHDCLFRVNWRWTSERRFVRPQMVFTGDAVGLDTHPECILGIRTSTEAAAVLRARRWHPRPWRVRYAALDCMPLVLHDRAWGARPTNGAAMIATAAALQPDQLVIAGIDLFEHPAGAYPDDSETPNAYLHMHDRDVEIAIIAAALASFRGEAVILSAPLRARLAVAATPQ